MFMFSYQKTRVVTLNPKLGQVEGAALGQWSKYNGNYSDAESARRATFQCVIKAINTS